MQFFHLSLTCIAVLEREHEERKEAEASVAAFRRQLSSIKEKCALLDVEIEQRRAVVQNLQRGALLPLFTTFDAQILDRTRPRTVVAKLICVERITRVGRMRTKSPALH